MATRVIAAQDKTSSGAGDDVQIKAGNANTSGAGGSIIIQPGAQATTGGNGLLIVRQPSGVAGTDEIQLSHDGGKGSVINKDGVLQLGGSHIALRTTANNAKTNLTAGTIYCDGIYSSNIINADGQTNDSYGWAIDSAGFNWNQGFNMRVGWSHIKGYANFGLAYTGDNTNGKRATLELTDGSTGGGAWAYRSSTTTVNTSYNDLNLSGHSAFQRLNATAATTITGIAPASTAGGSGSPTWVHSDGRVFWLYNIGTFNITLVNESASSTAGNRITTQTGANVVLGPGRMMQVVYDATSARWRATGETYPYVFPTADGTNGQVLTTNGSGTLSWTTVTSGGTVSGTTNYIAKFTGSTAVGNSLIYDDGSNVGIGTTSAQGRLDVVGANVYEPIRGITSSASNLESGANNALGLSVNNSNTTAGNGIAIGFNTATTNSTLYGVGAIGFNNLTHTTLGVPQGKFQVITRDSGGGLTPKLTIDTSGNVGIGTASPSNNLSIGASAGKIGFQRGSGDGEYALIGYKGTTGNDIYVFEINNTSGTGELRLNQGGTYNPIGMTFYTNNAEKMRIDSAGNVGIGTASPGAQLQVTSSAAATKGLIVKGAATQSANLTEWQDSTGAVVAAVSPTGAFTGSSFTPYGTFNSTTTIFGNNYWTPNYTGGVTSPSAGTYTKSTGNANTWDGQVYSSEGYTKNVYCAARASQTNGYIMFGLNSDPTTNADYGTLDYAWYFRNDGILQIYESGGAGSTYGAYTTSTVLSITYDGSNVQYWKDGVIQRTVARSTGNPLYFDTSFYTLSSSLNSVQFGPIGQPFGISGTAGYLPKFTSQQTLGNSIVYDNGTNVGIGTASPTSKLDVSTGTGANFRAAFAATNQVEIGNYSAASGYREIAVAGSQVYFQTNTAGSAGVSTRMLIDPSGNVGIGTTSPGAKLEIQTADGADSLALSGYKTMKWESNNHLVFGGYTAGQWQVLKFYTNGSERVRVTSGGLVGIGTSTIAGTVPLADLHVNDPSGYGSLQLSQSPYGATIDTGGEIQFAATYRSAYDLTQVARIRGLRENATNNNWAGYLAFYTSTGTDNPSASTERMRINSSGNVGIGTTSPNMALHVVGAKAGDANEGQGQLNVESTAAYNATNGTVFSTSGAGGSVLFRGKYNSGGAVTGFAGIAGSKENTTDGHYGGNLRFYTRANGANDPPERMRIDASGNVGIGNASPGAKLQVDTGATGTKGMLLKAVASQTANLLEFQNNSGTVLSYIAANGVPVAYGGGQIATNTAFGVSALTANTTGTENTAFGYLAGQSITTGLGNTAIGKDALKAGTSNYNTIVGGRCGETISTGGNNTAVGYMALDNASTGGSNNALGFQALYSTNGANNIGIGTSALRDATSGNGNVAIGDTAARYQVSGASLTAATNCVYIGNSCRGYDNSDTNSVVIGANAYGKGANTTVLGNTSTTANYIYGSFVLQNSSGTTIAAIDSSGNLTAVTKSFLIDHPTPAKAAEGKKLRYASLEGPENGVYYRGRLEGENEIVLPDYWKDLVDPESITVNLTARKFAQPSLFVVDANAEKVIVESDRQICCDFTVFATRKDVAKLEVEPDGN